MSEFSFDRNPDGGVHVTVGEDSADLTEQQWAEAVAYVSMSGISDGTVAAAAMLHKGRMTVEVSVNQAAIGRVMLKQAGGIELPEIVTAQARPKIALMGR